MQEPSSAGDALQQYRDGIDAIDVQLVALLKQRTAIVEQVAELKKQHWPDASFMRPGREARIIRKLMAMDSGAMPKPLLAQLWREIMMASLQQEKAFYVAVVRDEDAALLQLARNHFGAATPLLLYPSAHEALQAVQREEAMLAVVPPPQQGEENPWWPLLKQHVAMNIIFELPFIKANNTACALAIGNVPLESSDEDTSYLYGQTNSRVNEQTLRTHLKNNSLPGTCLWWKHHDEAFSFLVAVNESVAADDVRIVALSASLDAYVRVVGQCARPLGCAQAHSAC